MLADNGPRWTAYFVLQRLFGGIAARLDARIIALERERGLTGINSIARNRELWESWDWKEGGEEWTQSREWKRTLIEEVMFKYLEPGKDVLEIGPGAGRWSEVLLERAAHLALVDVTERCIELCRRRLSGRDNVAYFVNDGATLGFLADRSLDFVWSFDAFVHIDPRATESYLMELARVLRPRGRGVIHHPRSGRVHGGYRSSMTAESFLKLLHKHGLGLLTQLDSWGPDGRYSVRLHDDMITVFER